MYIASPLRGMFTVTTVLFSSSVESTSSTSPTSPERILGNGFAV
ncbi:MULTISPECIES: hypothetical protein [Streptomyces]|nr:MULTISPECIES: hypothetical protein [Streptomyces]